jgi:HEAT repeat protein
MAISVYSKKKEDIEFQYWERCRNLPEEKLIALLGHNNFKLSLEAAKVLQLKGGSKVIKLAQMDCFSNSYKRRVLAAFILGQINLNSNEEKVSLDILYNLALTDKSAMVRSYAVSSFGHRCNRTKKKYLDSLLALAKYTVLDKSVNVRESTAIALAMFDNKASIPLLIKLLKDTNSDVKDWAAFAVNANGYDTPEIRNCFVSLLNENNFEVRYEAIIGLSKMKDKRVTQALIKELSKDIVYDEMVQAAAYLGNVALLPVLYEIKKKWEPFDELNTSIKVLEHLKSTL